MTIGIAEGPGTNRSTSETPRRQISPLPRHVAIIMDGNGRWAQQRHLPRLAGHQAGTENIRRVIKAFARYEIPYLTLYAFSTENWGRPRQEVEGIMRILGRVIHRESENLHREGVKLLHLGKLDGLSPRLQKAVLQAVELTQNNTSMTLSVAFNYGGRDDILQALRQLLREKVPPEKVDEALFGHYLYTAGLPDPDLVIRTGGEMRISNFLLWQLAYAEYYSTPTFWPDFNEAEVEKALIAYSQRQRRFGGLSPD